jgi:hypothetical protein
VIFVRTPLRSAIALLFAIVHIVAAGGASIADGSVAAQAAVSAAYAHIEAHGTAECPRVHLEDCALCRAVHAHSSLSHPAPVFGEGTARGSQPWRTVQGIAGRRDGRPVSLRGPPGATEPRMRAAA